MPFRVGIGYDVHRLTEGRKLVLGGVSIPFPKGLAGHSDADVLVHAICDALLGAAALGDIGSHFPDTEEKFKDISSLQLLKEVNVMITNSFYQIQNIDSVIIAQLPELAPYISGMRGVLSKNLNIPKSNISIKATTTEHLGFIGRGEGIAAKAVVLLKKVNTN